MWKRHCSDTYKLPTTAIEWNRYQGSTWVRKDKKPSLQLNEFTRELETGTSNQITFFIYTNLENVSLKKVIQQFYHKHPFKAKDHTDRAKELQNPFKQ